MSMNSRLIEKHYRSGLFLMSMDGIGVLYPCKYDEDGNPEHVLGTPVKDMLECIKIPYPRGIDLYGHKGKETYLWDAIHSDARTVIEILCPVSDGLIASIPSEIPSVIPGCGVGYIIDVSNVGYEDGNSNGFSVGVTVWASTTKVTYKTKLTTTKWLS